MIRMIFNQILFLARFEPVSQQTAKATMLYNLAVAYAIRGNLDKASEAISLVINVVLWFEFYLIMCISRFSNVKSMMEKPLFNL